MWKISLREIVFSCPSFLSFRLLQELWCIAAIKFADRVSTKLYKCFGNVWRWVAMKTWCLSDFFLYGSCYWLYYCNSSRYLFNRNPVLLVISLFRAIQLYMIFLNLEIARKNSPNCKLTQHQRIFLFETNQ